MPSIAKPLVVHPGALRNDIGLTQRDYEGAMSTLCAGCGHDSVTAAIVRALWELSIEPHMLAKMSGIGCSLEDARVFRKRRARLQLGAWTHAAYRDRRECRQS